MYQLQPRRANETPDRSWECESMIGLFSRYVSIPWVLWVWIEESISQTENTSKIIE